MRVVFPDPLGPISAIKSPRERKKEIFRSTSRPWKPKETFSTKMRGSLLSIFYRSDLLTWMQGVFGEYRKSEKGMKGWGDERLEEWNIGMMEGWIQETGDDLKKVDSIGEFL
jgi:hypothetical protein